MNTQINMAATKQPGNCSGAGSVVIAGKPAMAADIDPKGCTVF